MVATAQQLFAAFLKERIAPGLRDRGFKGSGQVYRLPAAAHYLQVGFQKSVHNDAREVSFTINLQAVSRATWEAARRERSWLPEQPTPNTHFEAFGCWQQRAGDLMPGRRDVWWSLRRDTDLDQLARELLAAFDDWLIPALRQQIG